MTGRYKAYPEYKNTDEVWLGDVPSHWRDLKINRLTIVKRGASPRPIDDPQYFDETGEYAWVRIADVTASDTYLENTTQRLSPLGASLSVKLEPNELFLSIAGTVGKPCINKIKACIHDGFVYFPEFKENTKFLFYIFAAGEAYKGLGKFGTQLNLNTETVGGIKIGIPCIEEQQKIANFLNHETAKIDTLISKQEKLIELLKEKLLANRYHTVTKGLNPDVSFVETGISWTPLAPEHWSQVPNRSVMSMRRVLVGQNYRNYQLLSLTKKGVLVRNISSGEGKQSDHLDRAQEVREGDLVFCLFDVEETPRTVGLSHHLGMISGDYTVFESLSPIVARFLEYFYKAMDDRKLLKPLYRGLRKRIPKPGFLRVNIPVPPKEELENILQFLDDLEERIEQLTHLADKQVTLLKERKTALISAAVTGKIDVRDWEGNC